MNEITPVVKGVNVKQLPLSQNPGWMLNEKLKKGTIKSWSFTNQV
jgi:hypothetical protein